MNIKATDKGTMPTLTKYSLFQLSNHNLTWSLIKYPETQGSKVTARSI